VVGAGKAGGVTWCDLLTGTVALPAWRGEARTFHLLDRAPTKPIAIERAKPGPKPGTREWKPWALVRPGSATERRMLARRYVWKLLLTEAA
jgi:hypothetical protein